MPKWAVNGPLGSSSHPSAIVVSTGPAARAPNSSPNVLRGSSVDTTAPARMRRRSARRSTQPAAAGSSATYTGRDQASCARTGRRAEQTVGHRLAPARGQSGLAQASQAQRADGAKWHVAAGKAGQRAGVAQDDRAALVRGPHAQRLRGQRPELGALAEHCLGFGRGSVEQRGDHLDCLGQQGLKLGAQPLPAAPNGERLPVERGREGRLGRHEGHGVVGQAQVSVGRRVDAGRQQELGQVVGERGGVVVGGQRAATLEPGLQTITRAPARAR